MEWSSTEYVNNYCAISNTGESMIYSSALRHPESSSYIQLHTWMGELCQGNQCAALLLAFFAGWHDWKLVNDSYYRRFNDIAETHGDGRPQNENAYLFFTGEELNHGIKGIYGKKAINEALEVLVALGALWSGLTLLYTDI